MKLPIPYKQWFITQKFDENANSYYRESGIKGHGAWDLVGMGDKNIFCSHDGYVFSVLNKNNPDLMRYRAVYTLIEDNGIFYELSYGHFDKIFVEEGEIKKGQVLGTEGNCFDKYTEILTEDGWKFFDKLTKKEKVMTLNPNNGVMEFKKPTSYTKKREQFINYFTNKNYLDFAVTDNHSMYSGNRFGLFKLKNFNDLPLFSFVKQSGGIWDRQDVEYFYLPETTVNHGRWGHKIKKDAIRIEMDTFVEFLGWWTTDGWLNNGKGKFVGITQSFNNKLKRKKIEEMFSKLPFHVSPNKEDYRIFNRQLFNYLEKYGRRGNKKIPEFIFNLSPRQIKIFLDSFWLGDGWSHKGTKYYICSDSKMADQIQELLLKIGKFGTINMVDPTKRKEIPEINGQKIIAKKLVYQITEPKHKKAMIRKGRVERREYNDFAYCLTVDNHIIYVRRNGCLS